MAHLITVETAALSTARKLQAKEPRKFPPWKRLHLPLLLVEMRVARKKSSIPLDPQLIRGKELMLAELREVRERTVAFLEETKGHDLSVYIIVAASSSGQPGLLSLVLHDCRA